MPEASYLLLTGQTELNGKTMQDVTDWFKMFGVNGGVLGVVSLTDIELMLKIVMLILTCIWTTVKIWKLIQEE